MTTETQNEPSWPELTGSEDWQGLLNPLDLSLRHLILRCGNFCQATYDAFNNDQNSKYCGSSRYGKKDFFQKVMLTNASQYQVSSFLYATAKVTTGKAFLLHSRSHDAWDRESNWMGYIATTTDEASAALGRREIYVAWRGTMRDYEWLNVLDPKRASAKPLLNQKNQQLSAGSSSDDDEDDDLPKVMQGWLTIYNSDNPNSQFTKLSARAQCMSKIKELLEKYKGENVSIILSGHSLGAGLTVLSAFDLAENGITHVPISAFLFGSPRVGDKRFNDQLKKFSNVKILHIRNKIDLIPLYPPTLLLGYVETGIKLFIDTRKSPHLKDITNLADWHDLEAMLHIVAGWNGDKGEFELKANRSLALVNKFREMLREEYLIPGSWLVEKNKGIVRDENGEWGLAPPADEDLPVPEFSLNSDHSFQFLPMSKI